MTTETHVTFQKHTSAPRFYLCSSWLFSRKHSHNYNVAAENEVFCRCVMSRLDEDACRKRHVPRGRDC